MRWTPDYAAKEKISSNFFKEIPKLFRPFNWMYSAVAQLTIMMVYLGFFPRGIGRLPRLLLWFPSL